MVAISSCRASDNAEACVLYMLLVKWSYGALIHRSNSNGKEMTIPFFKIHEIVAICELSDLFRR
jgi:hypothetical protein